MAKEIAEQPEAVLDTLRGVAEFDPPAINLPDLHLSDADLAAVRRVVLIGMGTSFHSALIGRSFVEQLPAYRPRLTTPRSTATAARHRRGDPPDRDRPVGRDGGHARGDVGGAPARR